MPLTIRNMEIFATGVPQRTPLIEFLSDETHLNSMVTNFANGMGRTDGVPLKFGHTSPTFNRKVAEALGMPEDLIFGEDGAGRPRLGSAANVRIENGKLVADFSGVATAMRDFVGPGKAYSHVSSEVDYIIDVKNGTVVNSVLSGVALLGDQEPNAPALDQSRIIIENNKDGEPVGTFRAHYLYQIDNAALTIDEDPDSPDSARTPLDMIKDLWYAVVNSKTATPSGEPALENEEMDIAKIREALGLPEDTSEEDVLKAVADHKAAFDAAAVTPADPALVDEPPAEPVKSSMAPEHEVIVNAVNAAMAPIVERLTAVEGLNARASAELLDNEYTAACRVFNALPGTPEDLGKQLAGLERTVGREQAQAVLKSYEAANTNLTNAGLLSSKGVKSPSTDLSTVDHPFMTKVREFAVENKIDENQALARYAGTKPEEYAAFRRATRAEQK